MPAAPPPTTTLQGIVVPASSVNPNLFFARTRRQVFQQKGPFGFAGLGLADLIPIRQSGIVAEIDLQISASVTVTPGTGTVATTGRWPYDLLAGVRLSANGQSNLVNCSGQKLKARDLMAHGRLSDRGVVQAISGASPGVSTSQGTLSLASDLWGFGSQVTGIPAGTYDVELNYSIPVAFDLSTLLGAVFAQTAATDLNIQLQWATLAQLFVLTGNATVVFNSCTVTPDGIIFDIPQAPDGSIVVPDLSAFHSLIQSVDPTPAVGEHETRLPGQGVGRRLLRVFAQTWNNAASPAPIPVNASVYGNLGYRYGGSTTPESWNVRDIVAFNERTYSSLIGGNAGGYWCFDFAADNAFRDSVDEGAATELRLVTNYASLAGITNPSIELVQETVFSGAVGA